MSHLDERQMFTNRYGLRSPTHPVWPDKLPWAARHNMPDIEAQPHRCVCPGPTRSTSTCALRATQEDFLCDECRLWCIAVDDQDCIRQIASLPQFAKETETR